MEEQFKEILAQYTSINPEDMTDETRFREDMDLSSLDFMTMLGEVEDTFDIQFETDDIVDFNSYEKGIELLKKYDIVIE